MNCPVSIWCAVATTTIVLLWSCHVTDAYPTGPPSTACNSMTPGHTPNTPQSSSSNTYDLTLSANTYSPGSTVTVTLQGGTFRGFMIQARTNTDDYDSATGTFSIDSSSGNPCNSKAITHNENSDKTSRTVTWTAPNTNVGNITFVYTVVKTYTTFWVKLTKETSLIYTSSTTTDTQTSTSDMVTGSTGSASTSATTGPTGTATTLMPSCVTFLSTVFLCTSRMVYLL